MNRLRRFFRGKSLFFFLEKRLVLGKSCQIAWNLLNSLYLSIFIGFAEKPLSIETVDHIIPSIVMTMKVSKIVEFFVQKIVETNETEASSSYRARKCSNQHILVHLASDDRIGVGTV
jgi:hypothetical protein